MGMSQDVALMMSWHQKRTRNNTHPNDLGVCNDFTKRKCGFRKPRSYLAARLSACIRIPNDMDGEGFAATMIEIQLPSISCRQGRWIPHAWLHLFCCCF